MSDVPPGDPAELVASTRAAFRTAYGVEPLLVGHAPGRVNLIGEHTDYNGGLCLPVALPHRTYVAVAPRTDGRVQISSRQRPDELWSGVLADVTPEALTGWEAYAVGVLWAMGQEGLAVPGMDALVDSTVPLGAGLSSSAALECAVAMAALGILGEKPSGARRRQLASVCMRAETEVAGAPTGGMDQTVALMAEPGSALLIDFTAETTRSVALGADAPQVLVLDTGVSHALNDGGYAARRRDCEEAARRLGVPTLRSASEANLDGLDGLDGERLVRRARHVVTEIARVSDTVSAIEDGDWQRVGRLFGDSHVSLRDDFEVSCPELDVAVEAAVSAGALGARMTGGGFGGSAIALVAPAQREQVVSAVDAAFRDTGWTPPTTLLATPSGAADLDREVG